MWSWKKDEEVSRIVVQGVGNEYDQNTLYTYIKFSSDK